MDDINLCFSPSKREHKILRFEEHHKCYKGLLGGITDAIGITDYKGAEKAQSTALAAQEKATDSSLQIARENIAFQKDVFEYQKDQYSTWKSTYGDLSENLGEYYQNLTPGSKIATTLQAEATESQRAEKALTQQLAQRGMSGSGLEAAALTTLKGQSSQARAGIRATAEDQVKAQQMGFLSLGLGQGTNYLSQVGQQAATTGSAFNAASANVLQGGIAQGQIGSAYAQQNLAGSYGNAQGMMSAAGGVLGGMAAGGMFGSDMRFKNDLYLVKTIEGVNIYSWAWSKLAKKLGVDDAPTMGVIAQEIKDKYPDAVSTKEGYYYVDYSKVPKSIQEFLHVS